MSCYVRRLFPFPVIIGTQFARSSARAHCLLRRYLNCISQIEWLLDVTNKSFGLVTFKYNLYVFIKSYAHAPMLLKILEFCAKNNINNLI